MTELESWKSDAFRLMAENLKLEKQRDRLLQELRNFDRARAHDKEYFADNSDFVAWVKNRSRALIAEIEAEKEKK